jgi:hypothetical protein
MNIEKEYILTIDDHTEFQLYYLKKRTKKYFPFQWIIIYMPMFYVLLSSNYIIDYMVKMTGLIMALCLFLYYLLINIFSKYINKHFLKKRYYKNNFSDNIVVKITESSLVEYYKDFEQKIVPQWVYKFEENKNYIYLLNNKNYVIIIPKKYFSDEELEMIRKYYRNNKTI